MKKITIIDGYSLIFRAYFATAYPGVEIMRAQDGTPTNAIYAFSNMLNKIIANTKEGEALFVALDTGGTTFRKETLETYKANRKPTPQELKIQLPLMRDLISSLGVYQFEKEGFEGDDVAGSVAKKAQQQGYQVTIYTSDKDYLQLVNEHVTVNLIKRGLSDYKVMDEQAIRDEFGFEPHQIIDYKGLRGDNSDNLPGIPGIGEVNAIKLIKQYHSFDNIMANADAIGGKVGDNLKKYYTMGKTSRDLAIIDCDIPLPFDIEETIYHGYHFDDVNKFAQRFGLKSLINKLPSKWKNNDNLIDLSVDKISYLPPQDNIYEMGIALDNEGDYTTNKPLGMALSINNHHYYINFSDLIADQYLLSLLADKTIKKYCYDYKAIKVSLALHNIKIDGIYFDILIASYLLDSSLKNNVSQVFNMFGVDISSKQDINLFNEDEQYKSLATIAYYAYQLYSRVKEELIKKQAYDIYLNIELPLIDTLADMEIEGFPLDKNMLDEFGAIFKKKELEIAHEIYDLAGETFNIASPKQVAEILYDKLGLKGNKNRATSVEELKEIINDHPIVNKILEYRKYAKLLSTYVEGLKPYIGTDQKIHAHFNQAQTATGRLSSSNPNLQNISIRDEEGKEIRKCFYYNDGYEILSLDYSQIELRILAYLSNSPSLQKVFNSHQDIHSATAKAVFGLDREPNALERRKAKAVNFGIIYGISDYGLAEQLECSSKEARAIINEFYSHYPEISNFFNNIVNEAKANGYVSTLNGRRRYLREIYDSNYQTREFAKRAAMNAPIQGTAADLIKIAMIKVDRIIKQHNLQTKMVLQIHDELIFKVPIEEKEIAYKLIKDTMEHALEISVPLEVDGGYGKDWYSCK